MKTEIIGKFKSIGEETIVEIADELAQEFQISEETILEIYNVSDDEIKKLNLTHREKDEVTDVLSFPIGEVKTDESILGTIVIDEDYSLRNHEKIAELVKHGFLHLNGYDHETNPEEWEQAAKKVNHKMA